MGGAVPVTSPVTTGDVADVRAAVTRPREVVAGPTAGIVVYEKLEGRGGVFDGDRHLTAADYSLKDVEEVDRVGSAGRDHAGTPVGLRTIYGTLIALQAGVLASHVGKRLHLQLSDGRVLPFTVAKVLGPHRHLIQGLDRILAGRDD